MKKEIEIYIKALRIARDNDQVIGEKNDYYITLWQLDNLIKKIIEKEIIIRFYYRKYGENKFKKILE